jgi:hypothetical protein
LGEFIGQRYPYLPKVLFADTNPWWQNKTAVKDDYSKGEVAPEYPHTDWRNVYDELSEGIIDGESGAVASQRRRGEDGTQSDDPAWEPPITIHPTNQWFSGGPVALASAFLGDRAWLTFDASQSGHADYAPNPPIPWLNCRRGWEPVQLMYAAGGDGGSGKKRPALDNEPHYEHRCNNGKIANAYWNASDIQIGSWQTPSLRSVQFTWHIRIKHAELTVHHQVFSGAAGVTYGANNVSMYTIISFNLF